MTQFTGNKAGLPKLFINKTVFSCFLFVFLLLISPVFSEAYDILVLKSSEIKPYNDALEGFESACNCNISEMSYTTDEGAIREKILKRKPDAVLAIGLDAFNHVKSIRQLPVIYTMLPYSGTLNIEQKNISGVGMYILPARQLDTIIELFPNTKRIGIIYAPETLDAPVQEIRHAVNSKGLSLLEKKISRPGDVPLKISELRDKIDLLWMLPDTTVINQETVNNMLLFSFQSGTPVFSFSRKFVEMGATAAVNADPYDLGAQAGEIAKIILSSWPEPISTSARKAVLSINKKVASKLGLKIKDEIIKRAEYVY